MIKDVVIKNFKSLSNFNVPNLAQINLFGGKNNAGKTTILESLFLLGDRMNPQLMLRQYNWRGVGEIPLTPDALFAPIFKDFDLSKSIKIRITNDFGQTESLEIEFNNKYNRVVKLQGNEGQINTGSNAIFTNALALSYRKNEGKAHKANIVLEPNGIGVEFIDMIAPEINSVFLASKTHASPHENAVRYGELDIQGKTKPIIDYLKVIEPNLNELSSVALPNGTVMLYGEIGIAKKVPIPYMGDGTSRLLSIILSIMASKNGIVFIDEIENGIHYSALSKVWKIIATLAKEYNCQVFATTHNYECLDAAVNGIPEDMRDKFKYYRFEKNNDTKKTIANEFSFEVLQTAIENGWEVR
ncbi:MAG: AAA family ATPase [Bacillota bacterium]|nr:AAA family ATPase [Bacillota bacterium]